MNLNDRYIKNIIEQHDNLHKKYNEDIDLISELIYNIEYYRYINTEDIKWDINFNKLVAWISKYKRAPSKKSSDRIEKYLGEWTKKQKDYNMKWLLI